MRKLVVFGNGLGRALSNEYYDLQRALETAWDNPKVLDETQKRLIWKCLPIGVIEDDNLRAPRTEAELDQLQRVLAACDEILKYDIEDGVGWLSTSGKRFPLAIRSYIHSAASYFHRGPYFLPREFVDPLIQWVLSSRSHIATLNYDELLYRAFIGTKAFHRYTCLLDGFVPNFDPSHLERRNRTTQSFYLHLHGSPLYFSNVDGDLRKAALSQLPSIEGHSSTHLVLTDVKHKRSVIEASPILQEYWRRLEEAMAEVETILLFVYGGGDTHLNSLVEKYFASKSVEIVERGRPEYLTEIGKAERFAFWREKLGCSRLCAFWLDDVLSHRRWDYQHIWKTPIKI